MSTDTLPTLIVTIYYLCLLLTIVFTIFAIKTDRIKRLSYINVAMALSVPFIFLVNAIGRPEGVNELEYLLTSIKQAELWSVYVVFGFIFILVWWVLMLMERYKRVSLLHGNEDRP